MLVEGTVEFLYPEVVGIIDTVHAERIARVVFDLFFIHAIHIKRWISHHEVESAATIMHVFVVAIGLANITRKTVYCQVHAAQAHGLGGLLLTVNGDVGSGVLLVVLHETGALHEHATRTTCWIKDTSLKGFDDLDDQLDDGGGCEELTAFLSLGHGELAQEVFIDFAEDVSLNIHGYLGESFEQRDKGIIVELRIVGRQDATQFFVFSLDGFRSIVDRLANVFAFRQPEQVGETRLRWQVHDAASLVVCFANGAAAADMDGGG